MSTVHYEYYPGDTVSRYFYFKNKSEELIDPDSNTCEVYNPSGTKITPDVTLVRVSVGKFEFNYTLASDAPSGVWHIIVKGVVGAYANKEKFAFRVHNVLVQ